MTLEFGIATNLESALVRIPGRENDNYFIEGSPYEHVTHLKEHIERIKNKLDSLVLCDRAMPLETEDVGLLFQVNSFKRNLESAETFDWRSLEEDADNPWAIFLPVEDNNYRWWQITTLTPDVSIGDYKLYCIEMNSSYEHPSPIVRFNEKSKFEFVFATDEEMSMLLTELSK